MARRPRAERPVPASALPSREALRRYVAEAGGRVGKREIAREFGVGPELKQELRDALRDLAREGRIAPAGHRRFAKPGRLPDAAIIRITGTNPDGDALARPVEWDGPNPPLVVMAPERRGQPALAPGERVLARLKPIGPGRYEGRTLKRLDDAPGRILGVFRAPDRLVPTDRRAKAEWRIPPGETGGAEPGEIVAAQPLPHTGLGLKPVRVIERLGRFGDARAVSLICIETHGIPQEFAPDALAEAKRARAAPLGKREDLRAVPLVTIDGEDARDFDDAVFAEPLPGGGWRLLVAIADVAHYVRPGSALDHDARRRGNSVYFPDRVVPMLPEALSNGWCSLKPGEDRGCLFAEMHVGEDGRKLSHRFGRGLMRSAARLTYEGVQRAHDADVELGLAPGQLHALYGAFRALLAARERRGTLDLDLPERRVIINEAGQVEAIAPRPRLDSHRLIEEFMVLANVAAAEELERLHRPCVYRVHAPPSDEKLESLRTYLHGLGLSLPAGDQLHPRDLDRLLKRVAGTAEAPLVNEVVLRSQSQAAYSPDNIGHFGLALSRYAHFTSPIRRYADLLVHRSLIAGLRLGLGAMAADEPAGLADAAEHITSTERRAAAAEREAVDRYLAAYMADKVGNRFAARISGVTRFGLFVTIEGSGASGLVPMQALPSDYWDYDQASQTLTGRRTRRTYALAEAVEVRLSEANPVTGGLIFRLLDDTMAERPVERRGRRARPKAG
jgi:ribonuclease R